MNLELFSKQVEVRFRHADPAGIMFFGNAYQIAHDTYEDFVQQLGFEWEEWFKNPAWAVPIRHSSCEHLIPIEPGQVYDVIVQVERISKSSFTLKYVIAAEDQIYSEITLVHTFFDIESRSKMSIPSLVRDRLETYQREGLAAE